MANPNIGGNPAKAAAEAYRNGIIVNTIGIVDQKCTNEDALDEIVHIAKAGGAVMSTVISMSYFNQCRA